MEEHAAETMEVPHELMMLRIVAEREVARIVKGGIEIELKPDLNDVTCPIFDVERVVIETDLSMHNHLMQGLLA